MATLTLFRNSLIWGSFSPLFIIWALRGLPAPDSFVIKGHSLSGEIVPISIVLLLALIPNTIVEIRWRNAQKNNHYFDQNLLSVQDAQVHIVEYLLAVLLSMLFVNIKEPRELLAAMMTIIFVMWLFDRMNLHHVNIWLMIKGYRIYHAEIDVAGEEPLRNVYILSNKGVPTTGHASRLLRLDDRLFVL